MVLLLTLVINVFSVTKLQLVSFETFLFIGVKILYKIQLGRVKVHVKSNYMSITDSDTKHRTLTVSNILQKHKIYQWLYQAEGDKK